MDLLIVGASARAAAFSAARAGLRPSSIDLFSDLDLLEVGPARQVAPADYPKGLARLAVEVAPSAWIYTGALENDPELVDRVSLRHRLLGNPGHVLNAVRDPIELATAFKSAGIEAPEVQPDPRFLPADGSWLAKPRASAGGRGIRPWRGRVLREDVTVYYQRRVEGVPLSALFLAGPWGCRLLGITRQFVGKPGNRFAYVGTLAPWPVSVKIRGQVERIGRVIGETFGLFGLFGVDLVEDGERIWPIEVNPRYTAAVEALEWATGASFLGDHVEAFGLPRPFSQIRVSPLGFVGKAIVHAYRVFTWSDESRIVLKLDEMPSIADVPAPGTTFKPGDPVLTVLAHGADPDDCRQRLGFQRHHWRRRIARMPG